ncbi:hypothetical protein DF185_22840 [Marinifilum breve]|uniref:Peptidase S74 domain-containing protein n=1 Tax=Marinifilum breve TaxID=2184082 RepID=A0A2V3ZQZ6_9BACT|nr:hypothetical protein [Marinifilum breve]PXX94891.1 hypothetical protein DF185_22840 [Marinifilum breve]
MKKLLFLFFVVLISSSVIAQTNTFPTSGKVGIGTKNPVYPFELNSDKGGGGMFSLLNTTGTESSISYRISNRNINTGWVVGNYQDDYFFYSYTRGKQTVTFKPNGNIGVGIRMPDSKLTINTEGNTTKGGITLQNGTAQRHFWYLPENTRSDFKIGSIHGEWSWTNSNGEMVRINSSGNVGIGTTSPNHKLDVKGVIRTQELKVDMQGADFVFEEDYQLRSLEEVENFVQENKHLPDIAPAKEMQENGVNQSEMNQKLLQKIEELTLYVIEQNKLNQIQTLELKSLREENSELKVLRKENFKLKEMKKEVDQLKGLIEKLQTK